MSLQILAEQLKTSGLPVSYRKWEKGNAPAPPYLLYYEQSTESLMADGGNYYRYKRVTVELYTRLKDWETEQALENALAPYHWKKTAELWLEDQKMYMTTYEIEV